VEYATLWEEAKVAIHTAEEPINTMDIFGKAQELKIIKFPDTLHNGLRKVDCSILKTWGEVLKRQYSRDKFVVDLVNLQGKGKISTLDGKLK
jgi:hypothetical protein